MNTKSVACSVIAMCQITVVQFLNIIPIPFLGLTLIMFLMPFLEKKHLFITQCWEGLLLSFHINRVFPLGVLMAPFALYYGCQGTLFCIITFFFARKTEWYKKIMNRIGKVRVN